MVDREKEREEMISENGLNLIKYFEGCKLKAYADSAGIPTIGYGHTHGVKLGDVCVQEHADQWLEEDLVDAEKRVNELVMIKLQQCELDSLISQAFNLRSFPKLAEHLNRDRNIYLRKLLLYCHDIKGNELPGLKKRRQAECWLFTGIRWENILPMLDTVKT
jgi:lysozyme